MTRAVLSIGSNLGDRLARLQSAVDGLGASVGAVLAAANWPDSREPVMIVGHQPTLGMVASFLLSGEEAYWSVRKGAVWWLSNRVRDSGAAVVLKTVIGPDFL